MNITTNYWKCPLCQTEESTKGSKAPPPTHISESQLREQMMAGKTEGFTPCSGEMVKIGFSSAPATALDTFKGLTFRS